MRGVPRDPVSELFDGPARQLLDRMYARPGQWVGTRIVAPSPNQVAYFAMGGINVLGKDHMGRPRWSAGFVRAVYYQAKWHRTGSRWHADRRLTPNQARGISYEVGRMLPVLGVIPAGRAVRIKSHPGGAAAQRAVARLPRSERIYDGDRPGARYSAVADRDW